jgi:hypothetical protein
MAAVGWFLDCLPSARWPLAEALLGAGRSRRWELLRCHIPYAMRVPPPQGACLLPAMAVLTPNMCRPTHRLRHTHERCCADAFSPRAQVMGSHSAASAQQVHALAAGDPYVFAGDFNFQPTDDCYHLLTTGTCARDQSLGRAGPACPSPPPPQWYSGLSLFVSAGMLAKSSPAYPRMVADGWKPDLPEPLRSAVE